MLAFDPSLREMNLAALDQYLALRLIDAPLIDVPKACTSCRPAICWHSNAGATPSIRPYWDLRYEPKLTGSEDSLVDELEAQLEEALRLHMVSDVPVGAFLSGGMDSSLLVAMLAKASA